MSITGQHPPHVSNVTAALARDRLGVPAVIFFVMSAAAPLTVVAGLVTTGFAVTQVTGIPFAFLVIAVILGLFAVGYVAMAPHVANAGAFYAYVTHGLGRPLGVAAAWVALVAYNSLQVGLYGAIGAPANLLLDKWFGVSADWWVIALVAWALVAVLGVLRVDVNSRVLAVLLCSEIGIILVFDIADLLNPAGDDISLTTLAPDNLFVSGAGAVLALAVLGFVGFESSVVFSEESRDPRRTVPRATYLSVAIIGVLYALSAWAMTVATGPDQIVTASQEQQTGLIFGLAATQMNETVADIGSALFVTSLFAAMIAFHNTTARYMFALGRERVLPAVFGRTSRKFGAPKFGSIAQSAIGIGVIVTYAVAGWDPLVKLFFWLGTAGGFGVLVLVATTSLAVIVFFVRNPSGQNIWRRLVAPVLATAALVVVVVLVLANFHTLLNVSGDGAGRWVAPGVFALAAVLGVLWAWVLRANRPDVYATIGYGAKSAIGASTRSPSPRPLPPGQDRGPQP